MPRKKVVKNEKGVEAIKRVLGFIGGVVRSSFGMDKDGDGKVSSGEALSFGSSLIPQVLAVAGQFGDAYEELNDKITDSEMEELIEYVGQLDFLPPSKDHIEKYIRRLILWLNYNRRFTVYSIDFFKEIKENKEVGEIK